MRDRIYITKIDAGRIGRLVAALRAGNALPIENLERLEQELDRAEVVDEEAIPPSVVTLNAEVHLEDLDSGERMHYRLVLPNQSRSEIDISILAPVGTAILGYRTGEVVEWPVPKGMRRLKIHDVLHPQTSLATR